MFDISILLSILGNDRDLDRTVSSIAGAARAFRDQGGLTELVVSDGSLDVVTDDRLADLGRGTFEQVRVLPRSAEPLGRTLNNLVRSSSGRNVLMLRAGDLVSADLIASACANIGTNERRLFHPELLTERGGKRRKHRFEEQETALSIFAEPPYSSRLCGSRAVFERLTFSEAEPPFAHAEWHFIAEAAAAGVAVGILRGIEVAITEPWRVSNVEAAYLPRSRFFEPELYRDKCARAYGLWRNHGFGSGGEKLGAMRLSPGSSSQGIVDPRASSGSDDPAALGAAYYEVCALLRHRRFTDVVLLPFLVAGGGEKYILNVLHALRAAEPARRFLFLSGQRKAYHQWLDRLPDDSLFVDLFSRFEDFTPAARELLTLRIIQAVAPAATLHLKSSEFVHDFFTRHHRLLSEHRIVFYRFSDQRVPSVGLNLVQGYSYVLVSELTEHLDVILADNHSVMMDDIRTVDFMPERWKCLYTHCEALRDRLPPPPPWSLRTLRVLWASRISPEKRPELLAKIAISLEHVMPNVMIDVWGHGQERDIELLRQRPNINLRGGYRDFSEVQPQNYGLFLYTTAYDGLPNVVLEAMSSGLPVIAPDVGGLSEAVVDGETGILLPSTDDDNSLVDRYVVAIGALLRSEQEAARLGEGAYRHVQERHGLEAFHANVADVFGPLRSSREVSSLPQTGR